MSDSLATLEPHPWNTDFVWRSAAAPFRVLDGDQAARFDRDGFLVFESAFAPDLTRRVAAEIDGYERDLDTFLRRQRDQRVAIAESGAITFTTHLVARSSLLRSFATHPTLLGLCADLIGPDVNLYWDQAVYKKPEKPRRFPWHQDNGYTFVQPQQYLTCWVALTDATLDNGCPWVVPGVHRLGTLRHHYIEPLGWECFADPPGAVAATVGAGGIVVFSSLTPHMTGPNTTGRVRKAYILQYAPAGTRVQRGEPDAGPPTAEELCTDPTRQFAVLRAGRPVDAREAAAGTARE